MPLASIPTLFAEVSTAMLNPLPRCNTPPSSEGSTGIICNTEKKVYFIALGGKGGGNRLVGPDCATFLLLYTGWMLPVASPELRAVVVTHLPAGGRRAVRRHGWLSLTSTRGTVSVVSLQVWRL